MRRTNRIATAKLMICVGKGETPMARNEADREDMMSEAVSLIRRIEYLTPARGAPILAGFNAFGWLFVYVGNDVMYRFDEQGRLRRAFVDGLLYRTEGSTLAML